MIFTNFLVGLPVMLICLAIQAVVAFWSVRYYIRRMQGGASEQRMRAGLQPLLIAMVAMMFGTFTFCLVVGGDANPDTDRYSVWERNGGFHGRKT